MDGALHAAMLDLDIDLDAMAEFGLDDAAFEEAMAKFEAVHMQDVPKELRAKYASSRAQVQKQLDGVAVR
jgi:hypothetical protein